MKTSPKVDWLYFSMHGLDPTQAAGLVQLRTAQQTGTLVGVYEAVAAGIDEFGYATVCEEHGELMIHETRALAVWHATTPREWCSECRS